MPVPSTWADIFPNAAQNSPQGSEPVGTQADDYLRQAFAYCKQLHDGWLAADGSNKLTANLNANAFTVTNLAAPVNPSDAVPKSYADALISGNFPRGFIAMWFGTAATKPAGWLICDGTNGTPDMRNRMPIGAGDQTAYGQAGGNSFPVITVGQMPAHAHPVSDPGHAHSVYDPAHAHGVNDPGHAHSYITRGSLGTPQNGSAGGNWFYNDSSQTTGGSGTGIGIAAATTGISIYGSGTGVSLGNTGGNQAFDNRPAFMGVFFIMKA
jgi:microcystin-dependent protein